MARKKSSTRVVRGKGDYDVTTTSITNPLKRVEAKLDHLEKSLVHKTPGVSSAATSVGRTLGNFVNQGDLGALAGQQLAKWFGHGDYQVRSNSLMKGIGAPGVAGPNPPTFAKHGKRGTRITEREFLGDVFSGPMLAGSSEFLSTSYRLNPTDITTFPWLSGIAESFDQWEPHGVIFEFVSTSSDFNGASQALGTVVMATDYDPSDPAYTGKVEMENADYACSTKPSCNLMHGIECEPSERPLKIMYTRDSATNPAFSSLLGKFQLATVGCSTAGARLGELWVSYDITFYKKQVPARAVQLYVGEYDCVYAVANVGIWTGAVLKYANGGGSLAVITQLATVSVYTFPPLLSEGRFLFTCYSNLVNTADTTLFTFVNAVTNGVANYLGSGQPGGFSRLVTITAAGAVVTSPSGKGIGALTKLIVTQVPDDFVF